MNVAKRKDQKVLRFVITAVFVIIACIFFGKVQGTDGVYAAVTSYTNAVEFFESSGDQDHIVVYNDNLYFGTQNRLAASKANTRYRTVGYDVTLTNGTDTVVFSVVRGVSVKNIHTQDSGGYNYNLYCLSLDAMQTRARMVDSAAAERIFNSDSYEIILDSIMTTLQPYSNDPDCTLTEVNTGKYAGYVSTDDEDSTYRLIKNNPNISRTVKSWDYFPGNGYKELRNIFTSHDFKTNYNIRKPNTPQNISIYYHPNGGTVTSSSYKIGSDGFIWKSGASEIFAHVVKSSQKFDLYNTGTFGLTKTGYHIVEGQEWIHNDTYFNEDTKYYARDIDSTTRQIGMSANWQENYYTIYFDPNGGSGSIPSVKLDYTDSHTLPANTYTYTGMTPKAVTWNTKPDGSGTPYTAGQSVSKLVATNGGSITLYAQWEPNIYDITVDAQGGTGGDAVFHEKYANYFFTTSATTEDNTLDLPTMKGHTLQGLYEGTLGTGNKIVSVETDSSGNIYGKIAVSNTYYTNNSTVYAYFTPTEYTVTYDMQGGRYGTEKATATYGKYYPDAVAPSYAGQSFQGYWTKPNGQGTMVYNSQMVPQIKYLTEGNTTVYANWKDDCPPTTYLEIEGDPSDDRHGWRNYEDGIPVTASASDNGSGLSSVYLYMGTGGALSETDGKWEVDENSSDWQLVDSKTNLGGTKERVYLSTHMHTIEGIYMYKVVAYDMVGQESITYNTAQYDIQAPTSTGYTPHQEIKVSNTETHIIYESDEYTLEIDDWYDVENFTISLHATDYNNVGKNTIKYYLNGGTNPIDAPHHYYKDEGTVTLPIPTRVGYNFVGWYDNEDLTGTVYTQITNGTDGSFDFYAKWEPITYYIKFNGNGSTSGSMSNQTFKYDTAQNLTAENFTRKYTVTYNHNYTGSTNTSATAEYAFKNWNTKANGTGTSYANKQSVINLTTVDKTTINLYAQWTSKSVTLETPTRTGYQFAGWNTAADGSGTSYAAGATYTPTANVTLYAQWTPNTYYVSFNGNGSTSGSMSNQTFTYDVAQNLTAEGFTRAYKVTYNYNYSGSTNTSATATYTFKNWNTKADGSGTSYADKASVKNLTSTQKGTVPLYAQWTSKSVTLPTPTRTGYQFASWNTKADGSGTSYAGGASYTPTAAVTLYAQWTANTYYVSFNGNGSTSGSMSNQTFTYDQAQNLTAEGFTRAYTVTYNYNGSGASDTSATATYTFKNWNTKADGSGTSYADKASVSNLTSTNKGTVPLYAQWTSKSVTLPTPSKTGYQFAGWNTAADGSGTSYAGGASYTPTAAVTLYAQWTVNKGTVYYYPNGGSAKSNYPLTSDGTRSATTSTVYYTSTAANLYNVTTLFDRTGYHVPSDATAWRYGSATATTYINQASQDFSSYLSSSTNVTIKLYANWAANTYTVNYDANGGTGTTITGSSHTYDKSANLTANTYTRTGYTFNGWNTKADGSGTSYADKASVKNLTSTNNGTVTLYAQWKENHTHSYSSSVTTAATCTTAGVRTYTCSCGDSYIEAIAATGHSAPGSWSYADSNGMTDGMRYQNCTTCGTRLLTEYYISVKAGTGISSVGGSGWYMEGQVASVSATVSSGYTWSNWTYNSNNGGTGTMVNQNTTFPDNGYTISAAYTLTANATANKIVFNYYSNGADTLNGSALSSTQTKVATWTVTPETSFPNNHWNYTEGSSYYLVRTDNYAPTGYWGTTTTGGTLVQQDANMTSYADVCSKYGVSTSTASTTINLYAQWTPANAFAIYSATDGSFRIYNNADSTPTAGTYYNGLYVTNVWTGFRDLNISAKGDLGWYALDGSLFKKVVIEDPITPVSTAYWFYNFDYCTSMDLTKLNTSKVKNFTEMFKYVGRYSSSLSISGLSTLDVSSVTTFTSCFNYTGYNVTNLSLDLSGWKTNSLTAAGLSNMFCYTGYNSSTVNINMTGWDTSRITNTSYMFAYAAYNSSSFTVSGAPSWNMSACTNMDYMFYYAGYKATYSLNLSGWNVSNVTSYASFKSGVSSKITSPSFPSTASYALREEVVIPESGVLVNGIAFNETIPDTAVRVVFTDRSAPTDTVLTDVSAAKDNSIVSWSDGTTYYVSTQVTGAKIIANEDCNEMFVNKTALKTIDFAMLDTSNTYFMANMFANCQNLSETDLSVLNVSNVMDMTNMFFGAGAEAESFSIGDISGWDMSNVGFVSHMFAGTAFGCDWSLDLSEWDTSGIVIYDHFNDDVEDKVIAPEWVNTDW